jgi:hypothetical protein
MLAGAPQEDLLLRRSLDTCLPFRGCRTCYYLVSVEYVPLGQSVNRSIASIFLLIVYMWAIGITTSVTQFVKPPPYLFSDNAVSLLFLAPMAGVLIGELWGHVFNDFLQNFFLRKNKGMHVPEIRLWGCYPAVVVGVASLVLYGQTLQHSLNWLGIAFGWGMNSFCMLVSTTAISAYVLDVFPQHAALASSWLNFWRVTGK